MGEPAEPVAPSELQLDPHEPHWYSAIESNEPLVAEMIRWFDKYVKNAPPRPRP